jgi:hypothetical protein
MANVQIEEHPLGLTWILDEPMARACHALVDEGRVWLVDPVEHPDLPDFTTLGVPAGVLQLLDRHNRDCAGIADRLGVPHLKVPDAVPDSPFEAIAVVRVPGWKETALWWPQPSALVVAELLGTNRMYTAGRQAVGMHPFLRPFVPGALRGIEAEHLLVGHGSGVHGPEAAAGIEAAYDTARRDIPHVLWALPGAIRG